MNISSLHRQLHATTAKLIESRRRSTTYRDKLNRRLLELRQAIKDKDREVARPTENPVNAIVSVWEFAREDWLLWGAAAAIVFVIVAGLVCWHSDGTEQTKLASANLRHRPASIGAR